MLVTGASRGIGKAIAVRFAKSGFNVVVNCSKSQKELDDTINEIKNYTSNVLGFKTDVSDYNEVEYMFLKIFEHFGNIDVLVNNAGISYIGLFNEMSPYDWQKIINVNLYSVYNCCHVASKEMIKRKSGIIINISSVWGDVGASCEAVYSSSKGAVNLFTKSLGKELAPCNIRVNAISCGVIDTNMNNCFTDEERNALVDEIPLGRFGKCEDIAAMALFLSSDEAQYITGQIFIVDGGFI